ncbi:hypothetical protein PAECIP111802_02538 [Paenibacillus allorhizosphaerae]|uniref:Uncharacterized protein n=1 Tax=Paenibacillus allorhizosphaerae TaxID=2849866 RepID=A0ABN7TM84_9BACL|nr:hypothetical protein PAECIP111802_02538 [Paenibacillus allorhizosphaerae]
MDMWRFLIFTMFFFSLTSGINYEQVIASDKMVLPSDDSNMEYKLYLVRTKFIYLNFVNLQNMLYQSTPKMIKLIGIMVTFYFFSFKVSFRRISRLLSKKSKRNFICSLSYCSSIASIDCPNDCKCDMILLSAFFV